MDPKFWLELFGYLGSLMVIISMLMTSVVKLRIFNAIGSVISMTYALIVGAYPLAFMNICLLIINVVNLYKLLKTQKEFEIVVGNGAESMVRAFLDKHHDDILKFFPEYDGSTDDNDVVFMVCCNGTPVGALVGNDMKNGFVTVEIDYAAPAYRNRTVGRYLYEHLPEHGVNALMFTDNKTDAHVDYLTKMGFEEDENGFIKRLK